MTINLLTPTDQELVSALPWYIRELKSYITVYDERVDDIETELSNARATYDTLKLKLDSMDDATASVNAEVVAARSSYQTLSLHLSAINTRISNLELQLANAKGAYATLKDRLDAMDANRASIWIALNNLGVRITALESAIILLWDNFNNYYTMSEVDSKISDLSNEMNDMFNAIIDGSAAIIDPFWEYDINGDIMHVAALPLYFSVDPGDNLLGSYSTNGIAPRDIALDLTSVTDAFFELDTDNETIMPVN